MNSDHSTKRYQEEYRKYDERRQASLHTPECIKEYIRELEHKCFYLNQFIIDNHLWNESQQYLEEMKNEPIPFPFE